MSDSATFPLSHRLVAFSAWLLLVGIAYLLAAEIAFYVGTLSDRSFAPFWPPNVVLFCALLLTPFHRWWILVLAVIPAHVAAEMQVGMPPGQMTVAFATNCAVALLNALSVRWLLTGGTGLTTFYHAAVYIICTAAINPGIAAIGGAFVRISGGGHADEYWTYWLEWYAANALAQLTFGPIALAVAAKANETAARPEWRSLVEPLTIALGLSIACAIGFNASVEKAFLPALLYVPLPFAVWAAVRFGVLGASGAVLVITVVSISAALHGSAIFSGGSPESNVLALQLFLTGLSIPVLLLGASVEEMRRAEHKAGDLARSLLALQDEERRCTALELQDGACQKLAAASLLLSWLKDLRESPHASKMVTLEGLLHDSMSGLRAAAYLLHPPLLEEAGLDAALQSYVRDFTKRTGIAVALEVAPAIGRLPRDVEVALFRLVQEGLANVRHHSRSTSARIHVCLAGSAADPEVELTIEDSGVGLPGRAHVPPLVRKLTPAVVQEGVGLASVRQRLRRIGGSLHIDSTIGRTIVRGAVRLPKALPAEAQID